MKTRIMAIGGLGFLLLAVALVNSKSNKVTGGGTASVSLVSAPAPDFTLDKVGGGTFTLSEMKGKHPVLINFFATWCPPCNEEYPHLQKLYEKYKDQGLVIVSISTEPSPLLQSFAKQKGATFSLLTDPTQQVAKEYKIDPIPHNFLVDAQGQVVADIEGFSPEDFDQKIASVVPTLLAER